MIGAGPSKKEILKKLLERDGARWLAAPVLPELRGTTHLHTPRKVIQLDDGVCSCVFMRDTGELFADPIIGMRVAGWLWDGQKTLADAWRPGACAVIFRVIDARGNASVAMTSPSFAFFYAGNRPVEAPEPHDMPTARFRRTRVPAAAPQVAPLVPGSMTRMFY